MSLWDIIGFFLGLDLLLAINFRIIKKSLNSLIFTVNQITKLYLAIHLLQKAKKLLESDKEKDGSILFSVDDLI